MSVKEAIGHVKFKSGQSWNQFARSLDVSINTVHGWRGGTKPRPDSLVKLWHVAERCEDPEAAAVFRDALPEMIREHFGEAGA